MANPGGCVRTRFGAGCKAVDACNFSANIFSSDDSIFTGGFLDSTESVSKRFATVETELNSLIESVSEIFCRLGLY
jgi:hypothetical protein